MQILQTEPKPQWTLPPRLKDKWWRLTHLYKIMDKSGNLVTFTPNYLQLKHLWERGDARYIKLVKARQIGFTTLYEIDMLDEALWVPGMSCGIIAHRADRLEEYFEIVKRAFEALPPEVKPKTKADTKYKYKFTSMFNGMPLNSSIYVDTDIRGGTVQWLHITEIAYNKDPQKLKAGSKQAVPKTGRISEETTGNGYNDFYDEYMEARALQLAGQSGPMDYKTFFYSWIENPEYTLDGTIPPDEVTQAEKDIITTAQQLYNVTVTDGQLLWRRWKKRELKQKQEGVGLSEDQLIKQEYPLTVQEAFQSGAGSVFDLEKLDRMQLKPILTKEQIETQWVEQALVSPGYYTPERLKAILELQQLGVWFWYLPEPDIEYVTGVDPSDGEGADFGPINTWTRKPVAGRLRQVCQWYGKLLPDELAQMTAAIATVYNKAFVGVENNMITTVLFLSKIYDNVFYEVKIDEKVQTRSKKFGWNTNIQTREKMIDDFEIHHRDDLLEVNSPITHKEMRTFVRKLQPSGAYKREHADGKHDDSLFSDMIAVQMSLYRKPQARAFMEKASGW